MKYKEFETDYFFDFKINTSKGSNEKPLGEYRLYRLNMYRPWRNTTRGVSNMEYMATFSIFERDNLIALKNKLNKLRGGISSRTADDLGINWVRLLREDK